MNVFDHVIWTICVTSDGRRGSRKIGNFLLLSCIYSKFLMRGAVSWRLLACRKLGSLEEDRTLEEAWTSDFGYVRRMDKRMWKPRNLVSGTRIPQLKFVDFEKNGNFTARRVGEIC